ncbi:MAG: hypothetical protein HY921_08020 [Elusimicrobia bacterium]|nr:hypothetical protein [Elusimicrobiota bacterium]
MNSETMRAFLNATKVMRAPKRELSTFGATTIQYHLVSPVDDLAGKTRLRQGTVLSEKPKILTAEAFSRRFDGFGAEAEEFAQWLSSAYRDLLRALEYNFKNQGFSAQVLSDTPQAVAERILGELEDRGSCDEALIRCPDSGWSLALMKFTLDESARSFPVHVRDLERRGLFDPEGKAESRRRREIEGLFARAGADRGVLELLGRKLREYGLFHEYEDRYLGFF